MQDKSTESKDELTKYTLIVTTTEGKCYLAKKDDGSIYFTPVPSNGRMESVVAFDNPKQVSKYLKYMRSFLGEEDFKILWAAKPELGVVKIDPSHATNPHVH